MLGFDGLRRHARWAPPRTSGCYCSGTQKKPNSLLPLANQLLDALRHDLRIIRLDSAGPSVAQRRPLWPHDPDCRQARLNTRTVASNPPRQTESSPSWTSLKTMSTARTDCCGFAVGWVSSATDGPSRGGEGKGLTGLQSSA